MPSNEPVKPSGRQLAPKDQNKGIIVAPALAKYSADLPPAERMKVLEEAFREIAEQAKPPQEEARLDRKGIVGRRGVQRFNATNPPTGEAVSIRWLFKAYAEARREAALVSGAPTGRVRDVFSAEATIRYVDQHIFGRSPSDQTVKVSALATYSRDLPAETKCQILEALFTELVEKYAGGDGSKLLAGRLVGLPGTYLIGDPDGKQAKSYLGWIKEYAAALFERDNPGMPVPEPGKLRSESPYSHRTIIRQLRVEVLKIDKDVADKSVEPFGRYRPELPAAARRAILEEGFKVIVALYCDGKPERLSSNGPRGMTKHPLPFFGGAVTEDTPSPEKGIFLTWLGRYGVACFEVDNASDPKPGVTVSTIKHKPGYSGDDLISRFRREAYGVVLRTGVVLKSLANYDRRRTDREVIAGIIREIVELAGTKPEQLSGQGPAPEFANRTYVASDKGDKAIKFLSIVMKYALASYNADHGGNPTEAESVASIYKRPGYTIVETIARIQKELFAVEAVSKALKMTSLDGYSAALPPERRVEMLENLLREIVTTYANGDYGKLRSTGIKAFPDTTTFSGTDGKLEATLITWLRAYGIALRQVDLGINPEDPVNVGTILIQPGYGLSDLIVRARAKELVRRAGLAQEDSGMSAVRGFFLGAANDPSAVACVEVHPAYSNDHGYVVAVGMLGDRPLLLPLHQATYEPVRLIAHTIDGQNRIEVRSRGGSNGTFYTFDSEAQVSGVSDSDTIVAAVLTDCETALFAGIDSDTIRAIAIEHQREYCELMWQLVGWRLGGALDDDAVREAVQTHLMGSLERDAKVRAKQSFTALKPSTSDEGTREPITADQLNSIATAASNLVSGQGELRLVQVQAFLARLTHERAAQLGVENAELEDVIHALIAEGDAANPVLHGAYEAEIQRVERLQDILVHAVEVGITPRLRLNQLWTIDAGLTNKSVYAGDTMGGGKTRAALAIFMLSKSKEGLAVVPKVAMQRWLGELATTILEEGRPLHVVVLSDENIPDSLKNHPRITVEVVPGMDTAKQWWESRPEAGTVRLVLTTPEYYRTIWKEKGTFVPFFAIDEAHLFKNKDTSQGEILLGKEDHSGVAGEITVLIGGTPVENGPEDLLVPLKVLARGAVGENLKGHTIIAEATLEELSAMYNRRDWAALSTLAGYFAALLVRNNHPSLVTGRPLVISTVVHVSAEHSTVSIGENVITLPVRYSEQERLHALALRDPQAFEVEIGSKAQDKKAAEGTLQVTRLCQVDATPKIFGIDAPSASFDAVKEILRHHPGAKFVVGTTYARAARPLHEELSASYECGYIDGTVRNVGTNTARANEVNSFQEGKRDGLVVTLGAMGLSEELTNADVMIIVGLSFRPTVHDQFFGRGDRPDPIRSPPGKKLHLYYVVADHSDFAIQAAIWKMLEVKRVFHQLLVRGNLSKGLLEVIQRADEGLLEDAHPIREVHERDTGHAAFLRAIGTAYLRTVTAETALQVEQAWGAIAALYNETLYRKASFWLNQATFEYCVREVWQANSKVNLLDAGGGPGVAVKAAALVGRQLDGKNITLNITGFEVSDAMIELAPAGAVMVQGEFQDLGKKFEPATFTHTNVSFSFWYARDPIQLLNDCNKISQMGAVLTILIPVAYEYHEKFDEGLRLLGWEPMYDGARIITSSATAEVLAEVRRQYGDAFARELAATVRAGAKIYFATKVSETPEVITATKEMFSILRPATAVGEGELEEFVRSPMGALTIPEGFYVEGLLDVTPDEHDPAQELGTVQAKLYRAQQCLREIEGLRLRGGLEHVRRADLIAMKEKELELTLADVEAAMDGGSPRNPISLETMRKIMTGLSRHTAVDLLDARTVMMLARLSSAPEQSVLVDPPRSLA